MSFRFVNVVCTLAFALACGSDVVDAGRLPDETGTDDGSVGGESNVLPDTSTPDAGTPGGSGCAIPDIGRYRLVFDSDGGKLERRIYSMRADGTELEPLTPPGELAREPALSPDGQNLAYVTADGIRLMSMATGQSELLVPGADHPSWSPDGLRLLHRQCPYGVAPGLCLGFAITLPDRTLEQLPLGGDYIELSADGSTLVSSSSTTDPNGNYFAVAAMHPEELLSAGSFHISSPITASQLLVSHATISPDGVWLAAAIQCQNEQWPSLWVSPLAVSTPPCEGHRVTPAGAPSVLNPKWGPGNLIAYERATPPRDIAIVSADTGAECVLQGPGDDRNPSWMPLVDFASPQ